MQGDIGDHHNYREMTLRGGEVTKGRRKLLGGDRYVLIFIVGMVSQVIHISNLSNKFMPLIVCQSHFNKVLPEKKAMYLQKRELF